MTESRKPDGEAGGTPRPPELKPPDAATREPGRRSIVPLLLTGCGILLVLAALLVLFLPPLLENRLTLKAESQVNRLPAPQQPPAPQTSPMAVAEPDSSGLTGTWLHKQALAEAANIAAWGGSPYKDAVLLARECDRLFEQPLPMEARDACARAISALDEIMASKEVRLEEEVAAGTQALSAGDPETASRHFQQALAIAADDRRALSGARRAAQRPTVLGLLSNGRALQAAGDRAGALQAFNEAAALDPEFLPTQRALEEVRSEMAGLAFQQAMGEAHRALAENRLSAARSALQKAQAIKPTDPAVKDLGEQLERTLRAGRLTTLRQEAEALENEERWAEALQRCEEALTLDPLAAFAADCRERAGARIDLDKRVKAVLGNPERLFEKAPLDEARQLLARASATTPRGELLAAQIVRLNRLIAEAEAEVEILIRSDGQTDVVIYHVGRLGLFDEKRLVLRTGNYTAVGSRAGFRDVRQTLAVRPGSGKRIFTLRCEEPI